MRYRALDENGDYTFGHGAADFLVDSPAAVAQSIETRLRLISGEWFLDRTEGTPWRRVLGKSTNKTRDLIIQTRILQTTGVESIVSYESQVSDRGLSVSALVKTIYGADPVSVETQL